MRKYYLILVVFLSLISQLHSQPSFLDLYPLHIGNNWQYKITVDSHFNNEDTVYYSYREVLNDTIMPNGIQYKIISDSRPFLILPFITSHPYFYLRVDSSSGCVYIYEPDYYYTNDELLIDSLKMMTGDFFTNEGGNYFECTLVDSTYLFNENRLRKHFSCPIHPVEFEYKYVDGIGETYRKNHFEPIVSVNIFSELTYAKINGEEFGQLVSIDKNKIKKFNYILSQNYPNPFNPITKITYQILELSFVTLKIYDVLGNDVTTLVNEEKSAGGYETEFDGTGITSGIYFYQLRAVDPESSSGQGFVETKKMILLK